MDEPKDSENAGWLNRLLAIGGLAARAPSHTGEVAFPPAFLGSLERLRLAALRALGGGLREGHRLGAYKGGQLEFHGHRNYTPGDDLRYVDWNSYARLDRPYIKEFAREEAGVLHLLVDATPSMSLGQPSKWTFARRVAALFWHVAQSSDDIAHIYIFGGPELIQFPARGPRAGVRECLAFLEKAALSEASVQADGQRADGALENAVAQFLRRKRPRGRVIVIGDFWQPEAEIFGASARLSAAGFDASAIHVLASEEITPVAAGEILARSVEESDEVELTAGADLGERYGRELESHCRSVQDAFRRRGGNYLMQSSDTAIERVLIGTLKQRRWVS